MDKKTSKMGVIPHLRPHDFFFKNRALSLLYPYGALTSRSPRYSKTDCKRTTDRPWTDIGRTRAITKDPIWRTWDPKWTCEQYKMIKTYDKVQSTSNLPLGTKPLDCEFDVLPENPHLRASIFTVKEWEPEPELVRDTTNQLINIWYTLSRICDSFLDCKSLVECHLSIKNM